MSNNEGPSLFKRHSSVGLREHRRLDPGAACAHPAAGVTPARQQGLAERGQAKRSSAPRAVRPPARLQRQLCRPHRGRVTTPAVTPDRCVLTGRRSAQHHRLGPRHTDVPDAIPVADVLLHELAHGPRRGGLEAGDDLKP